MIKREQLFIGMRFDLPTRPGHYFRLNQYARAVKDGDPFLWSDRIDDKVVRFGPSNQAGATHVHGWGSYACFPSIERLLAEGGLPPHIKERWAFNQAELDDPENVRRDDPFIVFPNTIDEGVCVDRRGISTGQYGDGASGVTESDAELANDEETIHRIVSESDAFGRNLEECCKWRDVFCTEDGKFVAFDMDDEDDD